MIKEKSVVMDYIEKSKFLSLVLRHKPEKINTKLDKQGYANVDIVLKGLDITQDDLEYIVKNDSKQRYSFNKDHTKIRANQGHSINVDVGLKKKIPPPVLYHVTKKDKLNSIKKKGLLPMSRLYVHLSKDIETAQNVADRRKGESIILKIDTKKLIFKQDFFISENGVWLTTYVPADCISW